MGARLDQHFLIDKDARDRIVGAADLAAGELVVEIGPGRGVLTEALLRLGVKLTSVELDDRLALLLSKKFEKEADFKLVNADFLRLDLDSSLGTAGVKFVANLPFSVATPILQRILAWPHWTQAVLMFQKEVAERIISGIGGGADYGLLALSVMTRADAELLMIVPRESFAPRPKVASAVVRLVRKPSCFAGAKEEKDFFRVAKAAFGQRRKMAANPIASTLGLPRPLVVEALRRCGVDPSSRAEQIPLEAYLRLPKELGL